MEKPPVLTHGEILLLTDNPHFSAGESRREQRDADVEWYENKKKPSILRDETIENEVDALCQSLLLHPMNLPNIKKIAVESIKGLIETELQQARQETAREIFEALDKGLQEVIMSTAEPS